MRLELKFYKQLPSFLTFAENFLTHEAPEIKIVIK